MDLATVLQRPLKDPNWMVSCLKAGVLTLIPIVGVLIAMGWARRVHDAYAAGGDVLPDPFADIGGDLSRGLPMIGAVIVGTAPLFVVIFALLCCGGMVDAVGGMGMASMAAMLVTTPIYLLMLPLAPLIWSIHFQTGDWNVWKHMGAAWQRIMANPGRFGMFVLAFMIGNTVSGVGVFLCCVGSVLTAPLGVSMIMSALLEYNREA
jgi:hypothetical protein